MNSLPEENLSVTINITYSCHVCFCIMKMEREDMRSDRLIGILSILLQEEKTTAPELAEKGAEKREEKETYH